MKSGIRCQRDTAKERCGVGASLTALDFALIGALLNNDGAGVWNIA